MSGFADDYVEVKDRIIAFYAKYPVGSLQSEIVRHTDTQVVVKAYAYRDPEDAFPGIGHSAQVIPGKTPFTKDSEVENCETSAWGRAIAALGFEVKKSIASAEEVREKHTPVERHVERAAPAVVGQTGLTDPQRRKFMALLRENGIEGDQRHAFSFLVVKKNSTKEMTPGDFETVVSVLENPTDPENAKFIDDAKAVKV